MKLFFKILLLIFTMIITTVGEVHSSTMVNINILKKDISCFFLQELQFTTVTSENHFGNPCLDEENAITYRDWVVSLNRDAKGGGRVFWSGGDNAMNVAMNYAKSTGGTTLEMTRAGQNLQNLITTRNIPWSEARPMWERLSSVYARGANGTVHFFPGATVKPESIWLNIEKPILINNGVKIITHY